MYFCISLYVTMIKKKEKLSIWEGMRGDIEEVRGKKGKGENDTIIFYLKYIKNNKC